MSTQPPGHQAGSRLLNFAELLKKLSIGRTKAYQLIGAGALRPVKLGVRTLFVEAEVDDLVRTLPRLTTNEQARNS